MKEVLQLDLSPYGKVYWNAEFRALRCEWIKLFGKMDNLKELPVKINAELEKLRGDTLIIDTYNSQGIIPKEFMAFIESEINPVATRIGLKRVLTIHPKQLGFAAKSVEKLKETNSEGHLNASFNSLEECYAWLAEQVKQPALGGLL